MSREVPILQAPERTMLIKLAQIRSYIKDHGNNFTQDQRDALGKILDTTFKETDRLRATNEHEREIPCLNESMRESFRIVNEIEDMFTHYETVLQNVNQNEHQTPFQSLVEGLIKEKQKNCSENIEEVDVAEITHTLALNLQMLPHQFQRVEVHEKRITDILQAWNSASDENQPTGIKRFEALEEVITEAIQKSDKIQINASIDTYHLSNALKDAFIEINKALEHFIIEFNTIQQRRNELYLKIFRFAGREPPTPPPSPVSSTSSSRFFSSPTNNEEAETSSDEETNSVGSSHHR